MFLLQTDRLPAELVALSTLHHLSQGQYLYYQGEKARAVFIVVCGRVRLCTSLNDGRQVPLYTVRAGECVAEAALFADYYCSDVVAEMKSRVRAFPIGALQKTFVNDPELAVEFMKLQATRCGTLRASLELRSLRSARERILRYLSLSTAPSTNSFFLDRPLKNVADDLGLCHETFYRTWKNLTDEGLVSRRGKVIEWSSSHDRSEKRLATA